jgi:hypothetical protein
MALIDNQSRMTSEEITALQRVYIDYLINEYRNNVELPQLSDINGKLIYCYSKYIYNDSVQVIVHRLSDNQIFSIDLWFNGEVEIKIR